MKSQEILFYGGANSDDDVRVIGQGDFRAASHLRSGTVESRGQYARESYLGNVVLTNNGLPAGTNTIIGIARWDVERAAIIYFVHNSNNDHTIWSVDTATGTPTKVVQSSALEFRATDWIHHAFVVNGVLYWTVGRLTSFVNSNFSEPKQVDIQQAINFTAGSPSVYTGWTRRTFDFIKWPPPFGPAAVYDTDTTRESNFLYGRMYKFRYRYIYYNNEISALSPVSNLPLPTQSEFVSGRNWANTQADNVIEVAIETGPDIVRKIEVAISINDGPYNIFKILDKTTLSIPNNTTYQVNYYGNESLIALPLNQRNYDAVPIVSKCMEFLPTRQIAFGNFQEGYNKIAINISPSVIAKEIKHRDFQDSRPVLSAISSLGLRIFFSLGSVSDIFVGLTYVIPLSDLRTITFEITQSVYDSIVNAANPTQEFFEQIGSYIAAEAGTTGNYTTIPVPSYEFLVWPFYGSLLGFAFKRRVLTVPQVGLFKGATHPFGIQYYDRANRDGTVITVPVMNLYVPHCTEQDKSGFTDADNPYVALARMIVANQPPDFATHYQFVKQRPPIAGFQQRSVVKLETDINNPELIKLSLEGYYESEFEATINHNIQVGDVVRICRKRATTGVSGTWGDYASSYVELQVSRYDSSSGAEGEAIWVPQFDWEAILGGPTAFESFLIEIYTPSSISQNAPWHEISEEYSIVNPHTSSRYHSGPTVVYDYFNGGGGTFRVSGNYSDYANRPALLDASAISVTTAVYDPANNWTTFTTLSPVPNATGTVTFNLGQGATWPAILDLEYGDVYTRPRLMNTGFTITPKQGYYPIDDFYYSDYYVSNFSSIGRIAIESAEARQVDQKAVIRHGGSFIDDSQTNNLCLFDPSDFDASLALDEQFGPVNRMVMVGYTLKCLQDRKENSVYIKSTFGVLPGGSTQAGFTPQSQTFGGWNPAESIYGCIHPQSVRVAEGQLFYFDFYNGTVIRSLNNGQQNLGEGNYKYRNALNVFKTIILTIGLNDAWVGSLVDELNNEYTLTVISERTPSIRGGHVFRYDKDRWDHEVGYAIRFAESLGTYLVSTPISSALLYRHNAGSENTFYGTAYPSLLTFAFNAEPRIIKRPLALLLKTNQLWTITSVLTEGGLNYGVMDSEIAPAQWKQYENYIYADFLMDKTNVVVQIPHLATTQLALINGRELRGYSSLITATYTPGNKVKIFSAKVNYEDSTPAL